MQSFRVHTGIVAPLDRANVDTDAIIPKQFLTSIRRSGFGDYLFDEWRYANRGEPGMDCSDRPRKMDFVLNAPRYSSASILLARANFGCGSSREHAAWALQQYGFRVIVAPSFGDIFYQNSLKNGLLLITLPEKQLDILFDHALQEQEALQLEVDLERRAVRIKGDIDDFVTFEIDESRRACLLDGLDDVGLTLAQADAIRSFEKSHWQRFPWLREETTRLADSSPKNW